MAELNREDAIKLLEGGKVSEFNKKRSDDLNSYLDLENIYLPRVNLAHIKLEHVSLRWSNLQEVDLHHAIIDNSTIAGANLFKSNLSNIDINNSYIDGAYFREADLYKAFISKTIADNACFYRANLYGVTFSRVDLYHAEFREAYMLHTDFYSAKNLPISKKEAMSRGAYVNPDRGIHMIEISRPVLSSSVSLSAENINAGDEQIIIVEVSDKSNPNSIINAKITGEIRYHIIDKIILEEGYTNDKNHISYSWTVPLDAICGEYRIKIESYSPDYENIVTIYTTFRVINN